MPRLTRNEIFRASSREAALIVDPEISASSPLVSEIMKRGHSVVLADDPASGEEWVNQFEFSFALLELRWSRYPAYELIKMIARTLPQCRIIAHSAYCNISVAVEAAKSGADDVLPKPLEPRLVAGVLFNDNVSDLSGDILTPTSVKLRHVASAYAECGYKISQTARLLAMDRRALERFLLRHGITQPVANTDRKGSPQFRTPVGA